MPNSKGTLRFIILARVYVNRGKKLEPVLYGLTIPCNVKQSMNTVASN